MTLAYFIILDSYYYYFILSTTVATTKSTTGTTNTSTNLSYNYKLLLLVLFYSPPVVCICPRTRPTSGIVSYRTGSLTLDALSMKNSAWELKQSDYNQSHFMFFVNQSKSMANQTWYSIDFQSKKCQYFPGLDLILKTILYKKLKSKFLPHLKTIFIRVNT